MHSLMVSWPNCTTLITCFFLCPYSESSSVSVSLSVPSFYKYKPVDPSNVRGTLKKNMTKFSLWLDRGRGVWIHLKKMTSSFLNGPELLWLYVRILFTWTLDIGYSQYGIDCRLCLCHVIWHLWAFLLWWYPWTKACIQKHVHLASVQHSTSKCCFVLHCIILYCTALYAVQYSNARVVSPWWLATLKTHLF